jgi:7-carboxy-7-deazaguanine synthase
MHQPPTLKINEIFYSLQGEGLRQGEPTLFIRLSGCNLNCTFCDTKYAWEKGRHMSLEQIRDSVVSLKKRHLFSWICLTGGEPLLQDIRPLARILKEEGYKIQLETNAVLYQDLDVDWYTVSPKPNKYDVDSHYRDRAKEVKLVVTRELNLETVVQMRNLFPKKTPLLLQAQSNLKWSIKKGRLLLEQATNARAENIRLVLQMHKIIGIP